MSSTSYEQALALFEGLSFSDKLRFNSEIATMLKKGGKTGKTGKTSDSEEKPKRKTAAGTLAWFSFVKHCKSTMPDLFSDCKTEPERLAVCKTIRADDMPAYELFVKEFKKTSEAPVAVAEPPVAEAPKPSVVTPKKTAPIKKTATTVPAAPKKAPKTEAVTAVDVAGAIETMKNAATASYTAGDYSSAVASYTSALALLPGCVDDSVVSLLMNRAAANIMRKRFADASADCARVLEMQPGCVKAQLRKAKADMLAADPMNATATVTLPDLEINGDIYFHDRANNGLYSKMDDGALGAWVGFYQPEDSDEPIRYTESPADE
jgi:hypothetical protein